ncbi:MAG: hypothetical protein Unbinned8472contig1000_89 [Prokaryotic dsDNA virus sp.]|nr:MAG: hypothetical protein Unbinned8472contig1000_89 [Prokaryotic dsDNA virus sp.]|tara:strand:+ start:30713 stop:30907 length:195 start_codon:yes stop_codon:yes gene_type:complete
MEDIDISGLLDAIASGDVLMIVFAVLVVGLPVLAVLTGLTKSKTDDKIVAKIKSVVDRISIKKK